MKTHLFDIPLFPIIELKKLSFIILFPRHQDRYSNVSSCDRITNSTNLLHFLLVAFGRIEREGVVLQLGKFGQTNRRKEQVVTWSLRSLVRSRHHSHHSLPGHLSSLLLDLHQAPHLFSSFWLYFAGKKKEQLRCKNITGPRQSWARKGKASIGSLTNHCASFPPKKPPRVDESWNPECV